MEHDATASNMPEAVACWREAAQGLLQAAEGGSFSEYKLAYRTYVVGVLAVATEEGTAMHHLNLAELNTIFHEGLDTLPDQRLAQHYRDHERTNAEWTHYIQGVLAPNLQLSRRSASMPRTWLDAYHQLRDHSLRFRDNSAG